MTTAPWTTETVPASNWSGKTLTITVAPDRLHFTLYDERFELVPRPPLDPELADLDVPMWEIRGEGYTGRLGYVCQEPGREATAYGMEIDRSAPDRVHAAVQLLANLI